MSLFARRGKGVLMSAILSVTFAGFGAAVSAQDTEVAVYVAGDFPVNERSMFGTYLLAALINSGLYAGSEKSDNFLTEVYGEHTTGNGVITDGAVCEIGRRLDIKNICVATITPTFGFYKVSARMIYTGTPEEQRRRDGYHDCTVLFKGEGVSHLKTINDLTRVSNTIVGNMFGGNIPAAQTESEPAAAAPQSAVAGGAAAATAAAPPAASAAAQTASPTAALTAAASLAGEAKAAVDKVVAAVNAFKDATNKSVEAAEAVKTATQAKNFSAAMDAKKKVTAAADAVKAAKADVETAVEALKAAGPEAEAAVKAMGIDLAMFAGNAGGGTAAAANSPQPAKKHTFAAVSLDILGAGIFACGIYQDGNVKALVNDGIYKDGAEYDNAKKAASKRNTYYIIGSILLLSGISVHIYF